MSTFSKRLKSLRKDKRLTQKQLGELLFIDDTSISKYENEKAMPENELLQRIADFFGVSVDYLLGRTEEQKPSTNKINMKKEVETIAAHLEGKEITPKKMKLLKSYIDTLFDDFDDE